MSHLEDLLAQWYEWRGYIVRRNVKVCRLKHGGWEGELDIIAYHPQTRELVHLEPSIDARSWEKRAQRFTKKFESGKRYIYRDVFPWLDRTTPLRQMAILTTRGKDRKKLAGGDVMRRCCTIRWQCELGLPSDPSFTPRRRRSSVCRARPSD